VNERITILYNRGVETLRQPDRNPRCYEMTEEERLAKVQEWDKQTKNLIELRLELNNEH
jgi:hypothetical protein